MTKNKPLTVIEFPLTEKSAKNIIQDLAKNHAHKIKISKHARERLYERDISLLQIFSILKSNSSRFHEEPHQTPYGDWKMNLEGVAAGETIRIPLVLKRHEDDPSVLIITVINI